MNAFVEIDRKIHLSAYNCGAIIQAYSYFSRDILSLQTIFWLTTVDVVHYFQFFSTKYHSAMIDKEWRQFNTYKFYRHVGINMILSDSLIRVTIANSISFQQDMVTTR